MTTNMNHDNCSHPPTPAGRSACRKARAAGIVVTTGLLATAPVIAPVAPIATALSDPIHMGLHDAQRVTRDMLAAHGLIGWNVTFDNQRRRAGACNYARRLISLSKPLMAQRSYADTHMTITHEIAHALTPGHNHDGVWAAKHRELGGNGARCFEHSDETAPYIGTCAHGKVFSKYRAPKNPDDMYRCKCVRNAPGFKFVRNPNV